MNKKDLATWAKLNAKLMVDSKTKSAKFVHKTEMYTEKSVLLLCYTKQIHG